MKEELAKAWLEASYSDLAVIKEIIHIDYLSHMVAFHSQQSIEKSFKAILEYYDRHIPKKHNLNALYDLVQDSITIYDKDILEELNELYIDSRYPNSFALMPHGKPTLNDAKRYYNFASEIFENVANYLGIETNFN